MQVSDKPLCRPVIPTATTDPTDETLISQRLERLALDKIPREVVPLSSLPQKLLKSVPKNEEQQSVRNDRLQQLANHRTKKITALAKTMMPLAVELLTTDVPLSTRETLTTLLNNCLSCVNEMEKIYEIQTDQGISEEELVEATDCLFDTIEQAVVAFKENLPTTTVNDFLQSAERVILELQRTHFTLRNRRLDNLSEIIMKVKECANWILSEEVKDHPEYTDLPVKLALMQYDELTLLSKGFYEAIQENAQHILKAASILYPDTNICFLYHNTHNAIFDKMPIIYDKTNQGWKSEYWPTISQSEFCARFSNLTREFPSLAILGKNFYTISNTGELVIHKLNDLIAFQKTVSFSPPICDVGLNDTCEITLNGPSTITLTGIPSFILRSTSRTCKNFLIEFPDQAIPIPAAYCKNVPLITKIIDYMAKRIEFSLSNEELESAKLIIDFFQCDKLACRIRAMPMIADIFTGLPQRGV